MKKLILLTISSCCLFTLQAQEKYFIDKPFEGAQLDVFNTIITMFDGMREGDSAKISTLLSKNAMMHTAYTAKSGKPMLASETPQKWLNAVGTPHDQIWDEPVWDVEIKIDGNLAMAWVPYAFYLGENFSHCGVDVLLLNKEESGWKIFSLADTRQREGCKVPDEIKKGRDL